MAISIWHTFIFRRFVE